MGIFNKDSFKPDPAEKSTVTNTAKSANKQTQNWNMYHGGYGHGGYVNSGSRLNKTTVNDKDFGLLKSIDLEGSILSVPAIADGYIYVGVANSHKADVKGSNGGTIYKVDITDGSIAAHHSWQLKPGEGDAHGFYGMGCTPTVLNDYVYFSAFNGKVYCLHKKDLKPYWETDLRNADLSKNQPVSNTSLDILKNIFRDTKSVLFKSFTPYIIGLSAQAWEPIGKIMLKQGYETAIANELLNLGAQLNAATKINDKQQMKTLNMQIMGEMKKLIEMNADVFGKILEAAIPFLGLPVAAGWCSPLVVNFEEGGKRKSRLYVGVAEGENPLLFGFIYALDADTGKVDWVYCTNKNRTLDHNSPNELPAAAVAATKVVKDYNYTTTDGFPESMGCSVWAAIAYDKETGLIYASTGNPQPDGPLPSPGYSNGLLALKADTGDFVAFTQMPAETSYRKSDMDVDIGSSCTVFERGGKKVVGVGCKNGGFMVCDAYTLKLLASTSLLPKMNDGSLIPEIDVHPLPSQANTVLAPHVTNEISNENENENYFGPFNTAAIHPPSKTLFIGMGGPNYHLPAPGIDYNTTPFMKAIDMESLEDKTGWTKDNNDPPRYANVGASMYTNPGETGLSSPAVVNDVVFCSTTGVNIYAYKVEDGTLLWSHNLGGQTEGINGGYGFCLGPAIWKDYVVAGGLILGQSGGILEIYGLKNKTTV